VTESSTCIIELKDIDLEKWRGSSTGGYKGVYKNNAGRREGFRVQCGKKTKCGYRTAEEVCQSAIRSHHCGWRNLNPTDMKTH